MNIYYAFKEFVLQYLVSPTLYNVITCYMFTCTSYSLL